MVQVTIINRGTGDIEVHKPGCRDLKRNSRGASVWTIDAAELKDIVLDVYPPEDFSYNPETEWEEFSGDIKVIDCVGHLATPESPKSGRKTIDHTNHGHPLTPAARAACRKAISAGNGA